MPSVVIGNHSAVKGSLDPYGSGRHSIEGKRVARNKDHVRGWWENIKATPIWVNDKYELKRICEVESKRTGRTIIPAMFVKFKSQGKGIEWNF